MQAHGMLRVFKFNPLSVVISLLTLANVFISGSPRNAAKPHRLRGAVRPSEARRRRCAARRGAARAAGAYGGRCEWEACDDGHTRLVAALHRRSMAES